MALQEVNFFGRDKFDYASDPLEFKTPGNVLSLVETRILRAFTITADSYISLCSRVYHVYCTVNSSFAETICESAFQYYAVILLWKRFAQMLPDSTKSKLGFSNELARINDDLYSIPLPLLTYLKGIGHFRDPDGCDRRFVLPVFPITDEVGGMRYTFGKVSANTHSFYEALPAPGVAALRVLADIKYTKHVCAQNLLWDLPEGLRPDIQDSHVKSVKPTKNLLGWAPAQRLTEKQLSFLACLKIEDDSTEDNYSSLNANIGTLVAKMNESFDIWRKSTPSPRFSHTSLKSLPLIGSLVQGMSIEKHYELSKFDRNAIYCEGNVSVCSPYPSNDILVKGAVISGYRMAKEQTGNGHCWSCYDFDKYKSVPKSWICSRNMIYTYGSVGRLNDIVYITPHIPKEILQIECIKNSHLLISSPSSQILEQSLLPNESRASRRLNDRLV